MFRFVSQGLCGNLFSSILVNHLFPSDVFIARIHHERRNNKMKKILFTLVMIGLSGLIFSGQAMAGKLEQRQVSQQVRIWQGVKKGQLTRYETRNLWHEQQKIQRLKESFWGDGRLNRQERIRLVFWLDKADRHIFQLKHNSRRRPVNWQRASYHGHRRFW
jgi:hypothetical protein